MIQIRKGQLSDLDDIIACYSHARQFMRDSGNPNQWVNGYPSREIAAADISAGNNYVGVDSDGDIVMTFAFIIGPDPTYRVITDGEWLNNLPYGTIHRIASNGKYHGMMQCCVEFCSRLIDNIRLDTHERNTPMQRAAERLGFVRCGTIICANGTPRIAYQRSRQ